jgi:hypothetical protein
MGSVRRHLAIAASADTVWALVGAPGRLHEWFPVVATEIADPPSAEAAARGAVAQRWISLANGLRFEEDIVTLDHSQRRFQYRIVNNGLITQHLATVDVLEDGPDRCIVVYSTDMEPAPMALVISGAAGQGLETLKEMFEQPATTQGTTHGTTQGTTTTPGEVA